MKPSAALPIVLCLALSACGGDPQATAPAAGAAESPGPEQLAIPEEIVPDGDPRVALAAKMPGVRPGDLRATPVAGIYEVVYDGQINYVTADGQYVFSGNLFQVTTTGEFPNLTEARRRELRLQQLAAVPESEMIVFGSARAPHTVTVFTDVDCEWCQHLHAQVGQYNELGIRVRYMAYPRGGPGSRSLRVLESVWCAADRGAALTKAKKGDSVELRSCDSPVARHFALARRFGISGTPGVILPGGELIPGYMPPKDMLKAIEQSAAPVASASR